MSEIVTLAKNNWPWLVGGAIGIGLILYMRGGSSAEPVAVTTGGLTAAQSASLGLQSQQIATAAAVENNKTNAQAQVAFLAAQGTAAQGVGAGTAQILGALQMPMITAINAAAAENVATINGAVAAQIGSFQSQASTIQSMAAGNLALAQVQASANSSLASAVVASANSIGTQAAGMKYPQGADNSSFFNSLGNVVGTVASSYFGGA